MTFDKKSSPRGLLEMTIAIASVLSEKEERDSVATTTTLEGDHKA